MTGAQRGDFARPMTRWTEADSAPEQPWRETSSPGIRRLALQACREAIRKAQEPADKQAEKAEA